MTDQPQLDGMPEPPTDARAIIAELTGLGYSDHLIAAHLHAADVPTPSGRGTWTASKVAQQRDPDAWARYMRNYRRGRRGAT